jgi:cytoskeletal protein RodZ
MTIEGLGKKFQEARLARGLTLDEAARLTKIRPSRLAEIEADDFSQFPSLAYAKGFLLIYGKFLDVDVSPYLDVFETSEQMTVDGYSYLQDQPAPKTRRVRTHARARSRAPVVRRSGNRTSPLPVVIAIIAIGIGFVLMRLILDIQRIAPRSEQMVGVPQPSATATQSVAPPSTPVPTAAPRARVTEATPKKVAPPPVSTVAPSIPIPEAFVPAFANANAAAKASVAPKEPEVRRAEPVRPEDLAKAGVTQNAAQSSGPNSVAIKPLKKTYIKVVVDNETLTPAFERWISPTDGPVEFHGQHIAVRVLDRDAIQIKKNGKLIAEGDTDVTVE